MDLSYENVAMGIMTADENMTVGERRKVLKKVQRHCDDADRKEKGRILDNLEKVLGLWRNCLGRFLNGELKRRARTRQQGHTYRLDVERAVRIGNI